jgi:hypothetical protein
MRIMMRGECGDGNNQGSACTRRKKVSKLIFPLSAFPIFHCNKNKRHIDKKNSSISSKDAITFIGIYSKCQERSNEGYWSPSSLHGKRINCFHLALVKAASFQF